MVKNKTNLIIFFIFITFLILIVFLWDAIAPFIYGIIMSFIFTPLVKWLEKHHIKRIYGIFIVLGFFLFIIFLFFIFIAPLFIQESINLVNNLKDYLKETKSFFRSIAKAVSNLGIPLDEKQIMDNVISQLNNFIAPFFNFTISYLVRNLQNFLLNIILVPLTMFYILKDRDKIKLTVNRYLSEKTSKELRDFYIAVSRKLNSYLKSVLLISLIISVFTSTILIIWGVKHPIALGIFSGIISIIPYLGMIIQIIFIAIIQLSSGFEIYSVIWLMFTQLSFYGLIGFYLQPKITNLTVKIHPIMVIFSIMVGGYIYGIPGIIFSIPIYIVIQTFNDTYFEKYTH